MDIIDVRSDTVTIPTEEMRRVIADAAVGDDVYGEDPSINELQELAADMFGKEAALFVPTGTMANQVSLMAHTRPGDNVIMGEGSHTYFYESGASGALAGVQFTLLGDGLYTAKDAERAFTPPDHHFAPTTLMWIENTHNHAGGRVFPMKDIFELRALCALSGIPLHCDGARIFNASVAAGIPVREYGEQFTSLSFCLSKGLGCPVGSVIVGDRDFIDRAHRYRKMLGGGMRQAGFLAAAGVYALKNHVDRLAEDHANAKELARALARNPGFVIDVDHVDTNIINVSLADSSINGYQFVFKAAELGVKVTTRGTRGFRIVTHLQFKSEQVPRVVELLGKALDRMNG